MSTFLEFQNKPTYEGRRRDPKHLIKPGTEHVSNPKEKIYL